MAPHRPAVAVFLLHAAAGPTPTAAWTVMTLSGGGAKGAFEVGVLEGLCRHHPELADSWSMVSGTSIGALNAGILAQFPAAEQCSRGLPLLREHWTNITAQEDVFCAPGGGVCLTPLNPHLFFDFELKGGLCDPAPGHNAYRAAVSRDRIRSSGMKLRVLASSMRSGMSHWWTEKDDHVVEGCLASGSIAPLVYPKEVPEGSGHWYVDGGIFANTPIVKALEEGATSVIAILLTPLQGRHNISDMENEMQKLFRNVGFTVLNYYLNTITDSVFMSKEIEWACQGYPDAKILAYIPSQDLGSLMNFTTDNIADLMRLGRLVAESPPRDLCKAARIARGSGSGLVWSMLLVSCASVLAGVLGTSAVFKREALQGHWRALQAQGLWHALQERWRRPAAEARAPSVGALEQQLRSAGEA